MKSGDTVIFDDDVLAFYGIRFDYAYAYSPDQKFYQIDKTGKKTEILDVSTLHTAETALVSFETDGVEAITQVQRRFPSIVDFLTGQFYKFSPKNEGETVYLNTTSFSNQGK
jgi:hypothetical protein